MSFLITHLPPQRCPTSLTLYLENNRIPFCAMASLEELVRLESSFSTEKVEKGVTQKKIEAPTTEALMAWAQAMGPPARNKGEYQNAARVPAKKENKRGGEEKIAVEHPLLPGKKPKAAFLLIYLPPERNPRPLVDFLNTGRFTFFAHNRGDYAPSSEALWAWVHTLEVPNVVVQAKEKTPVKKKMKTPEAHSEAPTPFKERKIEAVQPLPKPRTEEPKQAAERAENESAEKEEIDENVDVTAMEEDSTTLLVDKKAENVAEGKPEEKKPELCPVASCPDVFTSPAALSAHMRQHATPVPCRLCGRIFKRVACLRAHYTAHQREKKVFRCTECPRQFPNRSYLKMHFRSHGGERPHACPVCERRFFIRSHVIKHLRVHTGEKPYACTECPLRFSCASTLSRHRMIHTGEQPFSCTECAKKFRTEENCRDHMAKHRGEKAYVCERCGRGYFYRSQLSKHRKKGC